MTNHQKVSKYEIMADINMVPLIDVALVLLIIFMVMTPILVKSQIKINLPGAATATAATATPPLEIQVVKTGDIYILGRVVTPDDLQKTIGASLRHPDQQAVAINADKDVPFEKVVTIMDAARKVGVLKISVGVKPIKKSGGASLRGAG
jgi:biopolymer transport protein ExbD